VDIAKANNIVPILTTMIPLQKNAKIQAEGLDKFGIQDSIEIYNNWLKNYCGNQNINFIDLNKLLSDDEHFLRVEFSSGPIDPNDSGYNIIASEMRALILKILDIRMTTGVTGKSGHK